jgi:NAD(P)H-dependent FMN reductase
MAHESRILAFAGSTRSKSYNKLLLGAAVRGVEAGGATCNVIDLKDYPLPIYDGDLEETDGLPDNAVALRELLTQHDGLLIASPEYNSSISAVLKNTIDWVTRTPERGADLSGFTGKVAALLSASPGALGGLRGLVTLRSLLGNIGVLVLANQVTVAAAHDAFAADGSLKDDKQRARAERLGRELADTVGKLRSA